MQPDTADSTLLVLFETMNKSFGYELNWVLGVGTEQVDQKPKLASAIHPGSLTPVSWDKNLNLDRIYGLKKKEIWVEAAAMHWPC